MSRDNKNINVLKRLDPNIQDIKDTYSHVVVYELIEMSWRKKGIEGTGFLVYNSDTSISLFVMNRLSLENHVFCLQQYNNLEILQDYVFYQSNNGIYGIWIYDLNDRHRFKCTLQTTSTTLNQTTTGMKYAFRNFHQLWEFIDPHNETLDFGSFQNRIQVMIILLKSRILLH